MSIRFFFFLLFSLSFSMQSLARDELLSVVVLPPVGSESQHQVAVRLDPAPLELGESNGHIELFTQSKGGISRPLNLRIPAQPGTQLIPVDLELNETLVEARWKRNGRTFALARRSVNDHGLNTIDGTGEDWFALSQKPMLQTNGAYSALLWDGGDGPALIIGMQGAPGIARWDGNSWSSLGEGLGGQSVVWAYAMTVYQGDLIVGGEFKTAGESNASNIARWNGTSWSPLGSGLSSRARALTVDLNGDLIAGGDFTSAGDTLVNKIARWDGDRWHALGSGMSGEGFNTVHALKVYDGQLVAGGRFTSAGGVVANSIARWDGTSWSAFDGGMQDQFSMAQVDSLTVYEGDLVAGGFFEIAGDTQAANIARWDGEGWSPLGFGTNTGVLALTVDDDGDLIAGGWFTSAGGKSVQRIARWDGADWNAIGEYDQAAVNAVITDGSGGLIVAAFGASRWDGNSWSTLGSGLNNTVQALFVASNGDLIVGGTFTTIGGTNANRIARWDGTTWTPFGNGIGDFGQVNALTELNGDLIVGGRFESAGSVIAENIARWDGNSWSALGTGLGGASFDQVNALLVYEEELIAAGVFENAGTTVVSNIARWAGDTWNALETGLSGRRVQALIEFNGELIAGGEFVNAGPLTVNSIARWNGSEWGTLGSGIGLSFGDNVGTVYALAIYAGDLVAAGFFDFAGGLEAHDIASWDGVSWGTLGSEFRGSKRILALEVDQQGRLIAGGKFDAVIPGSSVSNIVRLDGFSWDSVNSGLNDSVQALSTYGSGDLIVGGSFTLANGIWTGPIAGFAEIEQTATEITNLTLIDLNRETTLTATVTGVTAPLRGTVNFISSRGGACSDASLTPLNATTSVASCQLLFSKEGSYAITATYQSGAFAADRWAASRSEPVNFIVVNQTIIMTEDPRQPFTAGGTFELTSFATSGLPLDFTTTTPGVCTVLGRTVTMLIPGICEIEAQQAGDSEFVPVRALLIFTLDPDLVIKSGFEGSSQ